MSVCTSVLEALFLARGTSNTKWLLLASWVSRPKVRIDWMKGKERKGGKVGRGGGGRGVQDTVVSGGFQRGVEEDQTRRENLAGKGSRRVPSGKHMSQSLSQSTNHSESHSHKHRCSKSLNTYTHTDTHIKIYTPDNCPAPPLQIHTDRVSDDVTYLPLCGIAIQPWLNVCMRVCQ